MFIRLQKTADCRRQNPLNRFRLAGDGMQTAVLGDVVSSLASATVIAFSIHVSAHFRTLKVMDAVPLLGPMRLVRVRALVGHDRAPVVAQNGIADATQGSVCKEEISISKISRGGAVLANQIIAECLE